MVPSDVMARFALVSPIAVDETTVGGAVETDLPTITHADGMAILDEYFPISAIDSRPLNSAVAPDELSTSTTDTACRNFPLVPSILSLAPEESNTSPDIVSSESSSLPSPHQSTSGSRCQPPIRVHPSRYPPAEIPRATHLLRLIVPILAR